MGNNKFRTVIRYKGSRDGWMAADFHRMSDHKGPTVTLFKIKDNDQCVGGFTSAQWAPEKMNCLSDSTAMLFNLTTRNAFKVQDHTVAIYCAKRHGPSFGIRELKAHEPFNGLNKCCSTVNRDGYRITMDSESKSNLTNLKCKNDLDPFGGDWEFTISELEVWEIIFEK